MQIGLASPTNDDNEKHVDAQIQWEPLEDEKNEFAFAFVSRQHR